MGKHDRGLQSAVKVERQLQQTMDPCIETAGKPLCTPPGTAICTAAVLLQDMSVPWPASGVLTDLNQ